MIGSLIASKALPWVAGGLVVLLLGLGAAVYSLDRKNDSLNKDLGDLGQKNSQLSESVRQQTEDYRRLSDELEHRDTLIAQAQQAKQQAERHAREQIEQLRQALAEDECARTAHPAVVTDILRTRTPDPVQD